MKDIKDILSLESNSTDQELKEYFTKYVKDILDKEFKLYNVNIDYDQYPCLMFTKVDEDDEIDKEYALDAYYYVDYDGVYVAEIALISEYNRDFNKGNTFIELTRSREYEIKNIDNSITASIDSPFQWKEVTKKLLKNEDIKKLVKY